MWASNREHNILLKYDSRLRRIFRDTRILVRLNPDHEELSKKFEYRVGNGIRESKRYHTQRNDPITFEIIGSEALLNADSGIQQITERSEWQQAVEPSTKYVKKTMIGLMMVLDSVRV